MQEIKNIQDLRNNLLSKYENSETEQDKRDLGIYTASASAIIRSLKTEMDYNKYRENNNKIDFLENDNTRD